MFNKIATWVIRQRHITLCIIILITAFFVYQIKNMMIRTELSDLYPSNHPFIKIHNKYKDQLGSPFKVFMMLSVKDGDIYNRETLEKVIRITDGLDAIPGVNHNQVYSIASRKIKKTKVTEDSVQSENLMPKVPDSMDDFRKIIHTAPGILGVWVSRDEKSVIFTAGFIEHLMDNNVIFREVRKIIEDESDANHIVRAAGEPILMGWVNKYQPEIYFIFGVTFCCFILLLWIYFRNILCVILQIPPMILGVIWFLGYSGLLGYNVEPLTLVIPVLIVARSLSHSVQFTERYLELYHENGEKDVPTAVIKTIEHIFPPGLLGIVTDALGILLIAVAPVPMMQKLAYLCGLWAFSNIITGLLFTALFVTYCPSLMPRNIANIVATEKGLVQKILGIIAKAGYGKASFVTFAVVLILAGFTGWQASKVHIGDVNPGSPIFWQDSDYNVAIDQINKSFPGTEELYVLFEGPGPRALENPGLLRTVNSFQRYMEQTPNVSRTLSVTDLLQPIYRSIYSGYPKWETLPQNNTQACVLFNSLFARAAPGDFSLYFSEDVSAANVVVWYKDHMGTTLRSAIATVKTFIEDKKDLLAQNKCTVQLASGNVGLLAAINETVDNAQLLNFILVMGSCFILCSLTYKSFVAAIILMIPLNLTNIITLSIMNYLGIGLNINTLPIISVGVGVGIDYGIYLLSRICEESHLLENGAYSPEVTIRAVKTTGKAIFFTATTMIAGVIFWYFLSSLRFQAEMGLMLALIMALNLVTALVLIPVLVNIFKPKFITKKLIIVAG
ncbi:putative Exporters of the RND superfamily [uncultured Desulfobacterium sp.]|uniref:Putative Exporters of the RND superfamily n=1 Tax=uncultured Desulfobacterium sp. TaxID=201089 RepID=A0A445MXB5_9BACT|nr:putative Exporters of the RND superfamily [uncultured Desulfobacterium sp.]